MGFRPVRILMEKTVAIDRNAPFPTFHFKKFHGWFFGQHQREKTPTRPGAPKVAYFRRFARSITRWRSARPSSPCWSTTASR